MSSADPSNVYHLMQKEAVSPSWWLDSDFSLTPSSNSFTDDGSDSCYAHQVLDAKDPSLDRLPSVHLSSKFGSMFQRLLSPCRVCLGQHHSSCQELDNVSTCESKESTVEFDERSSSSSSQLQARTHSTVVSNRSYDRRDQHEARAETYSDDEISEEGMDWFYVTAEEGNTGQVSGTVLDVPQEVISRSALLRETLLDATDDHSVQIPLPQGVLHNWLRGLASLNLIDVPGACQDDSLRMDDNQSVVKVLHAADFLDDRELLEELIPKYTRWLFSSKAGPASKSGSDSLSERLLEASTLPTPLLVSILKLSGKFRVHHMEHMPPQMHAAALQAAYPSIAATSSLQLKITRNPEEVSALCPLIGELSSLSSLSLTITGDATVNHQTAEKFLMHLSRSFWKLRGLRKLALNNFDFEYDSRVPESGASALGSHLGDLTGLQELTMCWNRIGADGMGVFSRDLSKLTELTCFHFEAAGVGPFGAIELVPQIGKLAQLRSLNLYNDRLRVKGIRALVPHLRRLTCLEYLNLGLNDICNEAALVFAPALGSLLSLKHLLLARNYINSIQSIRILMHRITTDLPDLETLDLCYNGIYADAVIELAAHISKLASLTKLALRNPAAQCEFIAPLVPFLGQMLGLKCLNISVTWFCEQVAEDFAQQMTKLTNLTHLVMQRTMTAAGAFKIAPFLGELSLLEHLDLQENGLLPSHIEIMMPKLSNLTNLRILDLSKTGIGSQGAYLLLQSSSLHNLEDLDLSSSGLDEDDRYVFDHLLKNVPKLKRLAVADNCLGGSSDPPSIPGFPCMIWILRCHLCGLLRALHYTPMMQKLDFSGCRFSQFAVAGLAKILAKHRTIQELCLARVRFTDAALNFESLPFEKLLALRSLDLSDNRFTEHGWLLLLERLGVLPQTLKLYVGTAMDKRVVERLQCAASRNIEIFL